jgi:enediyne biosynthesis protein E4
LYSASAIYINDGHGKFTDETDKWSPLLKKIGIVTDAVWTDINHDGLKDLIVIGEWMHPTIFINRKTTLEYSSLNNQLDTLTGWWNTIQAGDFDGDGNTDLVLGNYGLNSQLKTSRQYPVQLYLSDLDGNGLMDPVLTGYIAGKSYPLAAMDDLLKEVPVLRKKFYDYPVYADATITDVFTSDQLRAIKPLQAKTFETIILRNTGTGFEIKHLPIQAQYAPVYSIIIADLNKDDKEDLILFGDNRLNRIRLGRDDANHGVVLINDGKANFTYLPPAKSGVTIRGDVRSSLMSDQQLFVGVNDDSIRVFKSVSLPHH